jgi:hypothetical protein
MLIKLLKKEKEVELDTVSHTCNPSYSGGSDQEASLGKQLARSPSQLIS